MQKQIKKIEGLEHSEVSLNADGSKVVVRNGFDETKYFEACPITQEQHDDFVAFDEEYQIDQYLSMGNVTSAILNLSDEVAKVTVVTEHHNNNLTLVTDFKGQRRGEDGKINEDLKVGMYSDKAESEQLETTHKSLLEQFKEL